MALTLLKQVAVSTGVGIADIVTEHLDQQQGLVRPFENISDLVRAGVTIGGYAYGYMREGGKGADYLTTAAVAYEPLLLRSVYRVVKGSFPFGQPAGSIRLVRSGQGYGPIIGPPNAPPPVIPGSAGFRPFVPS